MICLFVGVGGEQLRTYMRHWYQHLFIQVHHNTPNGLHMWRIPPEIHAALIPTHIYIITSHSLIIVKSIHQSTPPRKALPNRTALVVFQTEPNTQSSEPNRTPSLPNRTEPPVFRTEPRTQSSEPNCATPSRLRGPPNSPLRLRETHYLPATRLIAGLVRPRQASLTDSSVHYVSFRTYQLHLHNIHHWLLSRPPD